MVTPDIRRFAPGDLVGGAAELLAAHIAETIGEHGRCRFGLAGGSTPRNVYEQLATLPVSWDDVQLFWGDDGHTASLFPGLADLSTRHRVIAAQSPVAPNDRVTLTIRAINESRAVYFLVSGSAKAARLAEVASEIASGRPRLPSAFVQPDSGQLIWLIDTHAATQLKGSD